MTSQRFFKADLTLCNIAMSYQPINTVQPTLKCLLGNFFIFNLFDVKSLFSEDHIFCKQKRAAVYGCRSLVLDFKLTRENDDLLSSRHKFIFEVPHPVQEYTKTWILDKRYQTNTFCTFWGTWSASALRYLGLDHFGRYRTKICEI